MRLAIDGQKSQSHFQPTYQKNDLYRFIHNNKCIHSPFLPCPRLWPEGLWGEEQMCVVQGIGVSQCVKVDAGWSSFTPYGQKLNGLVCNRIVLMCFHLNRKRKRDRHNRRNTALPVWISAATRPTSLSISLRNQLALNSWVKFLKQYSTYVTTHWAHTASLSPCCSAGPPSSSCCVYTWACECTHLWIIRVPAKDPSASLHLKHQLPFPRCISGRRTWTGQDGTHPRPLREKSGNRQTSVKTSSNQLLQGNALSCEC